MGPFGGGSQWSIYWSVMQSMYNKSLVLAKSESSGGYSSYLVAISIMRAHFPANLMFHRIYDKAAIGEPSQRNSDRVVIRASLLSNGA